MEVEDERVSVSVDERSVDDLLSFINGRDRGIFLLKFLVSLQYSVIFLTATLTAIDIYFCFLLLILIYCISCFFADHKCVRTTKNKKKNKRRKDPCKDPPISDLNNKCKKVVNIITPFSKEFVENRFSSCKLLNSDSVRSRMLEIFQLYVMKLVVPFLLIQVEVQN